LEQLATEVTMRSARLLLVLTFLVGLSVAARGLDAKQIVQQAVQTELDASHNDHSHWLYYEADSKPSDSVKQWVAQAENLSLRRVLTLNGRLLSTAEQTRRMDRFIQDRQAQAKERKASQHDDDQAAEMLRLLPNGFVWTVTAANNTSTTLHFRPDPDFRPPDWETRVFAAMDGDMVVNNAQHRIVSLKGRLIHDVKFTFGLFGVLKTGGTFDVERRETGPSVWQITETHVHIQGYALLFKNISQNEDDVLSRFAPLPDNISVQQAKAELLKQPGQPE
jgi:hypothetical protein